MAGLFPKIRKIAKTDYIFAGVVVVLVTLWFGTGMALMFDDSVRRAENLVYRTLAAKHLDQSIKILSLSTSDKSSKLDPVENSQAWEALLPSLAESGVQGLLFTESQGIYPSVFNDRKISRILKKFPSVVFTVRLGADAGSSKKGDLEGLVEIDGQYRVLFANEASRDVRTSDGPYRHTFQIGHAEFGEDSFIKPYFRVNNFQLILHAAFRLRRDITLRHADLNTEQGRLRADHRGQIYVPAISPSSFEAQTYSLQKALISPRYRKLFLKNARAGDFIIISLDPIDRQATPASFDGLKNLTATVEQALNNERSMHVRVGFFVATILMLFGWLLGKENRDRKSLLIFLACLGCTVLVCLFARVALHWFIDWHVVCTSLAVGYLSAYGVSTLSLIGARHDKNLVYARVVPPQTVDLLPSDMREPIHRPSEVFVSMLFVDLVGYAAVSERHEPRLAIGYLAELEKLVERVVFSFDGIMAGRMGDSFFAVFGHPLNGGQRSDKHADRAMHCAVRLQKTFLQQNIEAGEKGLPHIPLRIGINTAGVFSGVANHRFFVVGHGVNFAKRLEMVCEPYLILLSPSTRSTLTEIAFDDPSITKKMIAVKHQHEQFMAFELNPFFDVPAVLADAISAYQKSLGLERLDRRINLAKPLNFKSDHGEGQLTNFSKGGLAILSPHYLARGLIITLNFEDALLQPELAELAKNLQCEVRWGRPVKRQGYLHGLKFLNLDIDAKQELVLLLHDFVRIQDEQLKKAS